MLMIYTCICNCWNPVAMAHSCHQDRAVAPICTLNCSLGRFQQSWTDSPPQETGTSYSREVFC